jgi:hypothetical protein
MKTAKYLAIAVGFVAVLLALGWFLRNTIIQRISNPILGQYDVTVTDVSLDALATSDASISYLELEHVNGTTIAIDDLTLPIGTSASGFKSFTAEKVTIELPAGEDAEPPGLARILNQLLALPLQLPNTEIIVTELSTSPYPTIHELRWRSAENNQQLTALVEATSLTTKITRTDESNHVWEISFADVGDTTAIQSITVDIQQADDRITLHGTSTLDLALWTPVAVMLGFDAIDVQSGSATLRFDTELPYDMDQVPSLYADISPTVPVHLTYSVAPDFVASVIVESAGQFEVSASLLDFQWLIRQAEASLLVSYDQWDDIRVSLINQSCLPGPACSGDIGIGMENAVLPFARVERLDLAATHHVSIGDDGIQVRVDPDATLEMTGISDPDLQLTRFDARLTSAAELRSGDDGWQLEAQSIDVSIEDFFVLDDVAFSAAAFLDDVSVSDTDQQLFVKMGVYASSSQAVWGDQLVALPGFTGGIGRQGAEVAVVLTTAGLHEEASIEVTHNLDNDIGQLSLDHAALSFDAQKVSDRVSPWPNDWDIAAGTVAIDVQADWRKDDTEWQLAGQTSVLLTGLAGAWNDTAFAGLSTELEARFDTTTGIVVDPSNIAVALVEVGLPIEDITADYTLQPDARSVDVENLRMSAFGGLVTADPFSFHTANASNTLLLHAESIDLGEILSIKEFESIEISGSIGAELPVTIEGNIVTIVGGTLTGEPPGGVIRYLPGLAADEAELSAIGVATRALSNFEYETLTSEVDYNRDGDLNLQMHLTGRNPDLENDRPVVLNLGVENNIPQMLRSLQAARAVEEILERRLAQ